MDRGWRSRWKHSSLPTRTRYWSSSTRCRWFVRLRDATYANDYRDLSVLKRIADTHGIAILLIHHLRKETG